MLLPYNGVKLRLFQTKSSNVFDVLDSVNCRLCHERINDTMVKFSLNKNVILGQITASNQSDYSRCQFQIIFDL